MKSAKRCLRFKTVRGLGGKRVRRCTRYKLSSRPQSFSRGRAPANKGARCARRKLVRSPYWGKKIFRCASFGSGGSRGPTSMAKLWGDMQQHRTRSAATARASRASAAYENAESNSLIGGAAAAGSKVFTRPEHLERRIISPGGVVLPLYRCGADTSKGLSPQLVQYLRAEMTKIQPMGRSCVQVPKSLPKWKKKR